MIKHTCAHLKWRNKLRIISAIASGSAGENVMTANSFLIKHLRLAILEKDLNVCSSISFYVMYQYDYHPNITLYNSIPTYVKSIQLDFHNFSPNTCLTEASNLGRNVLSLAKFKQIW